MNIKKIDQLIKSEKAITVFSDKDCKWIGNGKAIFRAEKFPDVDKEQAMLVFGIKDEDREKYRFQDKCQAPELLRDTATGDLPLHRMPISLCYMGNGCRCYQSEHGLLLVDESLLAPIDSGLDTWERIHNGQRYLALKKGLILIALILPLALPNDPFDDTLNDLAHFSEVAIRWKRENQRV